MGKNKQGISNLWDKFKQSNICAIGVPKRINEREGQKKYLQTVADFFFKFDENHKSRDAKTLNRFQA